MVEKLLEEVCFVLPTIGPESLLARATVVSDKYTDQIDKAAGRVPFHVHVNLSVEASGTAGLDTIKTLCSRRAKACNGKEWGLPRALTLLLRFLKRNV